MKRILIVSQSSAMGGAEHTLMEMATALRSDGVEATVVVPGPGPLVDALRGSDVAVRIVPIGAWATHSRLGLRSRLRVLAAAVRAVRPMLELLQRVQPDVVATNTIVPLSGAVAARIKRTPHVWMLHEYTRRDYPLHFVIPTWLIHRGVRHLSSRLIVPSVGFGDWVGRVSRVPIAVVAPAAPRVVAPVAVTPAPVDRLVVLGTRTPVKRVEDAVRALARLRAEGREVTLISIGYEEPAYQRQLEELCRALAVASFVEFRPAHDAPWQEIAAGSVLVSCSSWETFGRVLLEAMAHRVPVVASNARGSAELIRDGQNGLLFPPGDIEGLAGQISRLLDDPDLVMRLVTGGATTASQFDHARFVDAIRSAFSGVSD